MDWRERHRHAGVGRTVISTMNRETERAGTEAEKQRGSLLAKLRGEPERAAEPAESRDVPKEGGFRELVESIVVALVLAFLFRTYAAEAFVIPTGSMAPTLLGRHRDVVCQQCGFPYQVSASEEVDEYGNLMHPSFWIAFSRCPNCQYVNDVRDTIPFTGDRILVFKFPYDLRGVLPERAGEPQRWDVIVFRYPEDPETNYIKRLVVLPGEQPCLYNGDVYVRKGENEPYQILRKPWYKILAMRQVVYDNNYIPLDWIRNNWPLRWQLDPASGGDIRENGRRFTVRASTGVPVTLRYHHLVAPRSADDRGASPRPSLILDEYGYDNGLTVGQYMGGHIAHLRQHWVSDLGVACDLELTRVEGRFSVEFVRASNRYRVLFDLTRGLCFASKNGQELARARHPIDDKGTWHVEVYNFDRELTVLVDGDPVIAEGAAAYDGIGLPPAAKPSIEDTAPISLQFDGLDAEVSDLVVYRDIYYTSGNGYGDAWELTDAEAADPDEWDRLTLIEPRVFPQLGQDEFMMLGDNSPKSKDSRAWHEGADAWVGRLPGMENLTMRERREQVEERPGGAVVTAQRYFVHRRLLVGKAFFIYWPHGKPFSWSIPLGSSPEALRIPFYPQIHRMRFIR